MKLNNKSFVLALVIAAGIAAVATTKVRASADSQLLALMPPDSKILMGGSIDQAVASPVGQFILSRMQASGGPDELKNKTGFDIRTDLREVVVSPLAELGAARGAFRASLLEKTLNQANNPIEDYRGIRIVRNSNNGAALLDGTTLIIGKTDAVHQAIDRWITRAQTPENELMTKVTEVSATSQAWIAATDVSALQALLGPQQNQGADIARNVLNKIGAFSGQVTLQPSGGASVDGQLLATSPEDAQTLMDAYQAFKLLAPAEATNHPLFNRPQISLNGSTIKLGFAITQQEVETLLH